MQPLTEICTTSASGTDSEMKVTQEETNILPVEPLFKISSLGKLKGDGLIATRDIKAGELIFQEKAILIQDCQQGFEKAFQLMKEKHNEWLKLLPYYKRDVSNNATEYEIFKSQVSRCAFTELVNTPRSKQTFVLNLLLSKINHSCLPNASKSIELSNSVTNNNMDNNNNNNDFVDNVACTVDKIPTGIYAIRDILKGEEITIFYHPGLLFLPTNQRRMKLKQTYKFDCQCIRCVYTADNQRKVKKKLKKNKNNQLVQKEIEKATLFETLLKCAKFPKTIANNKSAKEKYIKKMKKEYDTIEASFESTDIILSSGKRYNVHTMMDRCVELINSAQKFVDRYENIFLVSTHWRIIQMKQLTDFSVRMYGGLIFDSAKKDIKTFGKFLTERIFQIRLSIVFSLMESQHTLLIKKLKYKYFNNIMCDSISYFDTWLRSWKFIHYDKNDLEKDEARKYCAENGVDALTQTKEKLSYLANKDGTALKCFVDSTIALIIDQNLLAENNLLAFASQSNAPTCAGKYCWFSTALANMYMSTNAIVDFERECKTEQSIDEKEGEKAAKGFDVKPTMETQCFELRKTKEKSEKMRLIANRDIAAGEIIIKSKYMDNIKLIRHSCLPNASKTSQFGEFLQLDQVNGDGKVTCDILADIYAMRDILKGEEITVAYDWQLIFLPTNERLKAIKNAFGFDCQCTRCQLMLGDNEQRDKDNICDEQEHDKIMVLEHKLQECKLPTQIKNDKKLQQSVNEYIELMKPSFNAIKTSLKELINLQTSGKVYSAQYGMQMFRLINDRCDDFLSDYQNKYLKSTHWRIIKLRQIKDISIRNLLAIDEHLLDNAKEKTHQSFVRSFYKQLLDNQLKLIQTEYQLLIEHLKYHVANDGLIIRANYVSLLMDRLFHIDHSNDNMNEKSSQQYQSLKSTCREMVQMAKRDATILMEFVNMFRDSVADNENDSSS